MKIGVLSDPLLNVFFWLISLLFESSETVVLGPSESLI